MSKERTGSGIDAVATVQSALLGQAGEMKRGLGDIP
jgi:hypothetical protein